MNFLVGNYAGRLALFICLFNAPATTMMGENRGRKDRESLP
ncbi:MAG: hypothetical protein CG439_333 [Methylococcaceae bacterium NSP1-2]|nr:MAG: hypothetical protein CG439_333 [Methylococcaceae bacterium NSP1-2]